MRSWTTWRSISHYPLTGPVLTTRFADWHSQCLLGIQEGSPMKAKEWKLGSIMCKCVQCGQVGSIEETAFPKQKLMLRIWRPSASPDSEALLGRLLSPLKPLLLRLELLDLVWAFEEEQEGLQECLYAVVSTTLLTTSANFHWPLTWVHKTFFMLLLDQVWSPMP